MDEVHYVSTIPCNDKMVEIGLSSSNQCPQVVGHKIVAVVNTLSREDRKARKIERIREIESKRRVQR